MKGLMFILSHLILFSFLPLKNLDYPQKKQCILFIFYVSTLFVALLWDTSTKINSLQHKICQGK